MGVASMPLIQASTSPDSEDYDRPDSLPYFEQNATIITNLTVHLGETVTMNCLVNVNRDRKSVV